MAAETITVFIDPAQVKAQKNNNYSLYLAKKVNGVFVVIWQSKGPVATVNSPSYEYQNTFQIQIPSYNVNYGSVTTDQGNVSFTSGGQNQSIELGQSVQLNSYGLFSTPTNDGTAGEITIQNQLQANPNAILSDAKGNVIFVNTASGMDIGPAYLTPIDTYQLWFDNYQDTGTIIAHNASKIGTVVFDGGTANKVISYDSSGTWLDGPLSSKMTVGFDDDVVAAFKKLEDVDPVSVTVLATFTAALTIASVTYLTNKLISKFSGGLKPKKITTSVGSYSMTLEFDNARTVIALLGADAYESAVNDALGKAAADSTSGLKGESWSLTDTLSVSY
jgi:hypothetical protein